MTYESAYDIADAFGYLTKREVDGIKEIVRSLPESSLAVNIGVGSGTSSIAIIEERDDISLISVDISAGGPFGGLSNEINALELRGINVLGRHKQVLMDSKEYAKEFEESADLVFIDGDHTYDGCKGDIEGWMDQVKFGGIIALHDYGSKSWPAVKKATDECLGHLEVVLHYDTLIAFKNEW